MHVRARGLGGADETIVHRARGRFGALLVVDRDGHRYLRAGGVDGIDQTVVERRRPGALATAYLRVATAGVAWADEIRRVLLVGLGGGAYARFLRRHFPRAAVDVVEIDPVVLRLASEFFEFREGPRLRVFVADAAEFVAGAAAGGSGRYDFVFLDAYHGQRIPAPLQRLSFFREVSSILTRGGVAVANVGLAERWAEDRVLRRFSRAFPGGCVELIVPDEDNRIAVGVATGLPSARRMMQRAGAMDRCGKLPFEVAPLLRERRTWSPD